MWLKFTRRTHYQIPFIYYQKISSNVRLMHRIKNTEIYLVQLAARPFPKHIYKNLRALLNLTLTRNEIGSFQTQTIHKSILLYKNRHFSIRNLTSPIQPKTCIHTCDLLFPFLLSSFLFYSSSFIFSSLLSVFALSFFKTKNEIFILVLYPFYFTFQSKEETSSLFPLNHFSLPQFSSLFHYNIFLLLLFGPPTLYYS